MSKTFKYLPFVNGQYSTAPGIKPTNKSANKDDRLVVQIDDHYIEYLFNKKKCRAENIHKYYQEADLNSATIQTVNRYLLQQLLDDYPSFFLHVDNSRLYNNINSELIEFSDDGIQVKSNLYLSAFDALANQVQEDLAVFQLDDRKDYLAAIHLCAPNHWSPGDKIGKAFDEIHRPIPAMDATNKHYRKIVETIVRKRGPFTRFAWGIATDNRLNHHPETPPDENPDTWSGRDPKLGDTEIYVRVERQNLIGFPEVNAFLFTIKTYFHNIDSLSHWEKSMLWQAVKSMSPASLKYKGLDTWIEILQQRLSQTVE